VSLSPRETIKNNYLCPVCGKPLTVGVMHRVEKLADRDEYYRSSDSAVFYSIIPLPEIIAEALDAGVNAKKVFSEYLQLLDKLGNEFRILLDTPLSDLRHVSPLIADAVSRMREGTFQLFRATMENTGR
jgi:PHP family Zn ribbon phosphoesterase